MPPVLRTEKKNRKKKYLGRGGVNHPPPPPAPLFVEPLFGDVAIKTAAPKCRGERRGWWCHTTSGTWMQGMEVVTWP